MAAAISTETPVSKIMTNQVLATLQWLAQLKSDMANEFISSLLVTIASGNIGATNELCEHVAEQSKLPGSAFWINIVEQQLKEDEDDYDSHMFIIEFCASAVKAGKCEWTEILQFGGGLIGRILTYCFFHKEPREILLGKEHFATLVDKFLQDVPTHKAHAFPHNCATMFLHMEEENPELTLTREQKALLASYPLRRLTDSEYAYTHLSAHRESEWDKENRIPLKQYPFVVPSCIGASFLYKGEGPVLNLIVPLFLTEELVSPDSEDRALDDRCSFEAFQLMELVRENLDRKLTPEGFHSLCTRTLSQDALKHFAPWIGELMTYMSICREHDEDDDDSSTSSSEATTTKRVQKRVERDIASSSSSKRIKL